MLNTRRLKLILGLPLAVMLTFTGSMMASQVFTGSVSQQAYYKPAAPQPQRPPAAMIVLDAQTGKPLQGVQVTIPDWQVQQFTDNRGSIQLPQVRSKKVLASVQKPGYQPAAMVMEGYSNGQRPYMIRLQRMGASIVLDTQLRHLGDNNYSPYSAGAGRFSKGSDGVTLVKRFIVPRGHNPSGNAIVIGGVIGLDTADAHRAGQSNIYHVASPMIVRINGRVIGQVSVNGENYQIPVPNGLLIGGSYNILEIEVGHHFPDGVRKDYDDIELMNIVLKNG